MSKDICEFCGKEKELGNSTPFHGFYCADCLELSIYYDKEALAEMKPKRRKTKGKSISSEELRNLEKAKDDALAALMNNDLGE